MTRRRSWVICSLSSHTSLSLLQILSKAIPNPITCSTVAPATLHLLEPVNAAFFSSKATSWSVNIIYFRFRIDSKMQKEIYYFPIWQDSRLSRACEKKKLLRWFEELLQLLYLHHTYLQTEDDNNIFQLFSNGQSTFCSMFCFHLCIKTFISTILITE